MSNVKVNYTTTKGLVQSSGSGFEVLFSNAATNGSGFDGGAAPVVTVERINNEIVTTILINLTGYKSGGAVKDVIGDNGAASAYFAKIESSVNGLIYKVEMSCIQAIATGEDDIILVASDNSERVQDAAYDAAGSAIEIVDSVGGLGVGEYRDSTGVALTAGLHNHYLYLTNGDTTTGTYGADEGKIIVRLFGIDSTAI